MYDVTTLRWPGRTFERRRDNNYYRVFTNATEISVTPSGYFRGGSRSRSTARQTVVVVVVVETLFYYIYSSYLSPATAGVSRRCIQ